MNTKKKQKIEKSFEAHAFMGRSAGGLIQIFLADIYKGKRPVIRTGRTRVVRVKVELL